MKKEWWKKRRGLGDKLRKRGNTTGILSEGERKRAMGAEKYVQT